jgi:hypothetical protein
MKNKALFYLNSFFMGSVLDFHKVIKNEGCRVLLDNGQYVSYRNGKYFKQIPKWERINYKRFDTRDDCIKYIKKNYNEYKELNHTEDLNEILNQKSLKK